MPIITLPDGSQRQFSNPLTIYDLAMTISEKLAKATLAAKVNEKLVDTKYVLVDDATVTLLTEKNEESLEVIRHSTAHLLAHAVKELFPSAQVTIGPVIDNGFYYDFAYERSFTPEDLVKIEEKMNALAQENIPIKRYEKSRTEAMQYFRQIGEEYKTKILLDIPESEILSLYEQSNFTDLCRGPHVPSTGYLKHFKLMKVAGAYWRGDSNNEMLQRIYGTAWLDKKSLQAYLTRLEEAEKRDHRKIAKALDLFHTQEEAPGMIFWHPNGWAIYQAIEQYMRQVMKNNGYQEVRSPQVVDLTLWQKSGHWEKFGDDMFSLTIDDRAYAIKPMNCPCHVQIYNQGLKSYRDLPLRISEFGSCHRNEGSGALHGLFRTRNFTQDDAHIFCTEEQIQSEVSHFIDLLFEVYAKFGFSEFMVRLSTRPEKRVGTDESWDKAEQALAAALNAKNLDWQILPGEGAFYGPKIEFILKDCLERHWTTGSVQLDFSMPMCLGAEYIAEDGNRHVPVMLHRAILGSIERFTGMLLEQYAGILPVWLAPIQVVILNITDKQADYAKKVYQLLQDKGFRAKLDLRNEKIGFKIREHTLQKIPYQLIIGDREMQEHNISVRMRNGEDLGNMDFTHFIELLENEIA
ncbi:MAG: Threonine--tRNA ligase [Legionellaceae bacterium]